MTTPVPRHLSEEERALWEKMEHATLGPWETGIMAAGGFAPDDLAGDHYVVASPSATPSRPNAIRCAAICGPTDDPNGGQSLADAEFIAAANPAVIRSLLTALSTARIDAALTIERLTDELTGATRLAVEARKQYDAVKVERDEARGALSSEREAGEEARASLTQELAEGLRVRGHWAPAASAPRSDIITAVFKAIDGPAPVAKDCDCPFPGQCEHPTAAPSTETPR